MYDDWLIQHGEMVAIANFPIAAEMYANRRLDYSEQKPKNV